MIEWNEAVHKISPGPAPISDWIAAAQTMQRIIRQIDEVHKNTAQKMYHEFLEEFAEVWFQYVNDITQRIESGENKITKTEIERESLWESLKNLKKMLPLTALRLKIEHLQQLVEKLPE